MCHTDSQATVKVSMLPTGQLYLPDRWITAGADLNIKRLYPDFSFLIQHPSGTKLMFDLGIRKDLESYPPAARGDFHLNEPIAPHSAADILAKSGITPESVNFVVYSHLHWDHVGDSTEFPSAQLILGPGATEYASPGYPALPDSPFLGTLFKHPGGVRELSRTSDIWRSFPPFERAFDLFSDGSILLVDAPGHMPGHLIAVARTSVAGTSPEYVIMGGDCCHHRSLFTGESQIGVGFGPTGLLSMHLDLDMARNTVQRVGELGRKENFLVCLAHDAFLYPPLDLFPAILNGWRERGVKSKIELEKKTKKEDIKPCPV